MRKGCLVALISLCRAGFIQVDQSLFANLSGFCAREGFDEIDLPRSFNPGQGFAAMRLDGLSEGCIRCFDVGGFDNRENALAIFGIGNADDRHISNGRMADDAVFNLLRIDVDPARDDGEVLATS